MMKRVDIVRAWKDEEYRTSLSEAERAALPQNPAGPIEQDDGELAGIVGGNNADGISTLLAVGALRTQWWCPPPSIHWRPCPPRSMPLLCPANTVQLSCPHRTVGCPQ
jgi:mersacidin/lichenicidin family type 2 lantibiotic